MTDTDAVTLSLIAIVVSSISALISLSSLAFQIFVFRAQGRRIVVTMVIRRRLLTNGLCPEFCEVTVRNSRRGSTSVNAVGYSVNNEYEARYTMGQPTLPLAGEKLTVKLEGLSEKSWTVSTSLIGDQPRSDVAIRGFADVGGKRYWSKPTELEAGERELIRDNAHLLGWTEFGNVVLYQDKNWIQRTLFRRKGYYPPRPVPSSVFEPNQPVAPTDLAHGQALVAKTAGPPEGSSAPVEGLAGSQHKTRSTNDTDPPGSVEDATELPNSHE